jgi:hypothetical protein
LATAALEKHLLDVGALLWQRRVFEALFDASTTIRAVRVAVSER